MFLLKFVTFLLVTFLIFFSIDKILRKVVNIEKRKGIIYKPVNKSQKTGEKVLLVLFFISLIIQMVYSPSNFESFPTVIIFLGVLNLYRAFMELKYQKESKEYIITFSNLVLFIIFMFLIFKLNVIAMIFD